MNKRICAVFLSILAATSVLADVQQSLRFERLPRREILPKAHKVNADLCPLCIQFTDQALDILLNIILNAGIVGSCETLCAALEQKTGSKLLDVVCNILCDVAGIEEFVKIIEKADLDPIYFCELLKVCKVFDGGDAVITNITITPQTGPQGEKSITIFYNSKNGTGTGEIVVAIRTIDGIPVESAFLQEPQNPGAYRKGLKLDAKPDPSCDPTQEPCEQWLPGNYILTAEICNGECGSKHPHSKVYDRNSTNFTITG